MYIDLETFDRYLAENIPTSDNLDIHSALDFIYCTYMEWNPIHTEEVRSNFNDLGPVMDALSRSHADLLFSKVCALCEVFEKEAFLDGFFMGAKLSSELYLFDRQHKRAETSAK